MARKRSEKLTPVTSQARYPRLIELRQEGGILFKGFAAAVLATGLAGCGKSTEKSLTPDASALDTRSADTGSGQIVEVGGKGDLRSADTGSGQIVEVGGKGDLGSPDRSPDRTWIIVDGGPVLPPDTRPDTPADVSRDLSTPDLRSPDWVMIVDGGPPVFEVHNDTAPKDAIDARDATADQQGPDGALDGVSDSQGDV